MAVHPAILRRRINELGWADKTGRAEYAWDFTNNQARWNSASIGALANTPNWTFSRASTAYYTNSAGVLTSVASGVLRTGDRGALIEGAGTNLCLQSQTFDNASWTKARSSVSANAIAAPDGTTTADKLVEDGTASNTHYVLQSITVSTATSYTVTIYVKAAERTQIEFRFGDTFGANGFKVQADLSSGTLSSGGVVGSGYTYSGATITALTGGWYRIALVGVTAATTSCQMLIYLISGGNSIYTGDGVSGLYLWGAQLEAASFPSSYIPTTTASATRAADSLSVTGVTGLDYPLTLFAEFERVVDTNSTEEYLSVRQTNNDERARTGISSTDLAFVQARAGGVDQGLVSVAGAISTGVVTKVAARCAANSLRVAKNGALSSEDTSVTVPAVPNEIIFANINLPFGYLRRAAIYASAKTDAQLQVQTS